VLTILLSEQWREVETVLSAHAISALTNLRAVGAPSANVLVLYRGPALFSVFRITSECSAAYLVGALSIVAAPLALTRRLHLYAVPLAVLVGITVITAVNIARLVAISESMSWLGAGRGFSVGHTYLGTFLTFAGVLLAGAAFALTLLRVGPRRGTLATAPGVQADEQVPGASS
jgi:exosortase/archaeosortase family protein